MIHQTKTKATTSNERLAGLKCVNNDGKRGKEKIELEIS